MGLCTRPLSDEFGNPDSPLDVAEFLFRDNDRANADIFGAVTCRKLLIFPTGKKLNAQQWGQRGFSIPLDFSLRLPMSKKWLQRLIDSLSGDGSITTTSLKVLPDAVLNFVST